MNWIRVEDRLPENKDEVLVWEKWSTIPFIGYWNGRDWFVDHTFANVTGWDGGIEDRIEQKYISHWQPLPPAPKGDE